MGNSVPPQTILIVLVLVIGLLLLAIGGCYLAQFREGRQLDDRTGPDFDVNEGS